MSYPNVLSAIPLRRYLLGQLGEEDTERLDRRLLADGDAFAELEAAQDDLIEDYLDGTLDAEERAAFEAHFLASPLHQRSLECARMIRERMLRDAGPARRNRPGTVGTWLGAIAALLLIAIWLVKWPPRQPKVADQATTTTVPSPAVSQTPPLSPGPLPSSAPSASAAPIRIAATLVVNRELSGEVERTIVRVDRGAPVAWIEILVESATAYRSLAAQLVRDGTVMFERKGIKPQTVVRLSLPSPRLAPGEYTLILTGSDPEGSSIELDRWELVVPAP
jgi:hypothetical protein